MCQDLLQGFSSYTYAYVFDSDRLTRNSTDAMNETAYSMLFADSSVSLLYLIPFECGIGLVGNALVIALTLSRRELRTKVHNWFIGCLAVSDFMWCLTNCFMPLASTIWMSGEYPTICFLFGFFLYFFLVGCYFWPPLIAFNRYIGMCRHPAVYQIWFSRPRSVLMCIGVWLLQSLIVLEHLITREFGEDFGSGFCGPAYQQNPRPLAITAVAYCCVVIGYTVSLYYNWRMRQKLKELEKNESQFNSGLIKESAGMIKLLLIVIALPMFEVPNLTFFLLTRFIHIPYWAIRVALLIYPVPSVCTPFLVLRYVRPYRLALIVWKRKLASYFHRNANQIHPL